MSSETGTRVAAPLRHPVRWGVALPFLLAAGACVSAASAPVDMQTERNTAEIEQRRLPPVAEGEPFGHAQGRVLIGGQPLAGCRVRAVLLGTPPGAAGNSSWVGGMVEADTDADGRFRFERLPVGIYRLKWWIPGSTHWVRALSPDPDFAVRVGETASIRPIETKRPVLGD